MAHAKLVGPTSHEVTPDIISFVPELKCRAELQQETPFGSTLSVEGVIDTGAGFSYILGPERLPFKSHACHSVVCLADGTQKEVTRIVETSMSLGGQALPVVLRVLPMNCPGNLPTLLIGRDVIQQFGINILRGETIEIRGNSPCYRGNEACAAVSDTNAKVTPPLVIRNSAPAPTCQNVSDRPAESPPHLLPSMPEVGPALLPQVDPEDSPLAFPAFASEAVTTVQPEIAPADSDVSPPCPKHLLAVQEAFIAELTARPAMPIPHAPRCSMVLRAIREGERQDCAEQTHVFEIDLPQTSVVSKPRLYAHKFVERLKEEERAEHEKIVKEYVRKGLWRTASEDDVLQLPGNNVFPVVTAKKVRLVADMRPLNGDYPATTSSESVQYPLFAMRLARAERCTVFDVSGAFYAVRVTRPLLLYLGTKPNSYYLSDRMVFGCSFGPCGLDESLGTLWRLWQTWMKKFGTTTCKFVDDFFFGGTGVHYDDHLALFLSTIRRCGFTVSSRKFQSGSDLRYLNVQLKFSTAGVTACCQRDERLAAVQKFVDNARRDQVTKTDVFSAMGAFSYDPLQVHGTSRLVANIVRQVIGSQFAKVSWTARLDMAQLTKSDQALLSELWSWTEELLVAERNCKHFAPLMPDTGPELTLLTDASLLGGAYRLISGGVTLAENAWSWKRAQYSYHINRLECIALMKGLRAVAFYLDYSVKHSDIPPVSLSIRCDSKTVVTWTQKPLDALGMIQSSAEYRQLIRLISGVKEELKHLRGICRFVSVEHIAGVDNDADHLSRLLARRVRGIAGNGTVGSLLRERTGGKTVKPDSIRVVTIADSTLAENVCSNSYDIEDALDTWAIMRHILRSWSRNLSDVPDANVMNVLYCADDFRSFCRNFQQPHKNLLKNFALEDGVHVRALKRFNGEIWIEAVVPTASVAVGEKIIRSYHRSGHRGARHVVGAIRDWYLVNGMHVANRVISRCVRCMTMKHTSRTVSHTIPHVDPREVALPAFSRVSIDYFKLGQIMTLSVACRDTGVLALLLVDGKSLKSAMDGLLRLMARFGVGLKAIHSDNEAAFRSREFARALRRVGERPDFTFTSIDSPFANPVERLHKESLSVIRSSKFVRSMLSSFRDQRVDPLKMQDQLDMICQLVNSRPIGISPASEQDIITPNVLAFGVSHGVHGEVLAELRSHFYEHCFDLLRRRHRARFNTAQFRPQIGARVLVYRSTSKLDPSYAVGRVVDIINSQYIVRTSEGTRAYGSLHLCPLYVYDAEPLSTDVSRLGARVTVGQETVDAGLVEFLGTVVRECENQVEIKWDEVHYPNELINWGACRVV